MLGWGMTGKQSAGILMYRFHDSQLQVLLVHPGGPFWAKKDAGAWSIPKGEFAEGEDPLDAAKREFREETGCAIDGALIPLRPLKQRGGKLVYMMERHQIENQSAENIARALTQAFDTYCVPTVH